MVIEKLRTIVETIGGLAFMYDDWNRVNKRADMLLRSDETPDPEDKQAEGVLPACFVILPAVGRFDLRAANYRDAPELQICFVTDTELDFDGLENESLIEQMKLKCLQFIAAYNESGLFQPLPDIVDYRPLYDILQANLTGVYIQVRVEEVEGFCVDDLLPPEPTPPEPEGEVIFDYSTQGHSGLGIASPSGEIIEAVQSYLIPRKRLDALGFTVGDKLRVIARNIPMNQAAVAIQDEWGSYPALDVIHGGEFVDWTITITNEMRNITCARHIDDLTFKVLKV